MSAPGDAARPAWNVLATSFEGQREALLGALRGLGRFRRGGYRNVVVARVDDPPAFLDALRAAYEQSAALRGALAKAIPVERVVGFGDAQGFVPAVTAALEPLAAQLAGSAFYVRVVRRGHRGALDSSAAEREIGGWLWRVLEARGAVPVVRFDDPDVVVAIETLRDDAGIALVTRALRTAYPFVRVR